MREEGRDEWRGGRERVRVVEKKEGGRNSGGGEGGEERRRKPDDDGWAKPVDFRQIFTTQEAVNITDNRGGGPKGHLGKQG